MQKNMRNEKNLPYCTSTSVITSLPRRHQNIGNHRLGKTKKAITFLSRINIFSFFCILIFQVIHRLLDVIMRRISKMVHIVPDVLFL